MTDAQLGARTAAPYATPSTGLALTVEPRRRYDPNTGKSRKAKWAALSDESAEFLMRDGRPAENIRSIIMTGQGRDFRFRRDIPWKNFPHIQRPIYDYGRAYITTHLMKDGRLSSTNHFNLGDRHLGVRQNTVGRKTSRAALTADLAMIEEIIVVADPWDDRLVWEAIAPVFTVNRDVAVWHRTFYEVPCRIEFDELLRLEKTFRAHDHLIYNYTYNMIVLGSRARHAAARLGPGSANLASAAYHLFHEEHEDPVMDPSASFSPFAIEALQLLARTTDTTIPAMEGDYSVKNWREPFSRLPFMTCKENGEVHLNWAGSGKLKPWIEKLTHIHNPPVYGGSSASDHMHDLASLYASGLATILNGELVPTNTGRAFLDIVGDSVHDPDLLLRWRQSGDVMASEDDFPAVDRWLASKFRRLKRRVAALPSSPLTEASHPWRTRAKNKLVVRGFRIDAAEWDPQQRNEIASAIHRANDGLPRSKQSMGVVMTDDPFEPEEAPIAFWFGRPLAIVPAARGHSFQYNCNLDTASIDDHLIEPDCLPIQLRGHDGLTRIPGYVAIGTEDEEDEFLTLPQHIPMKDGRSLVSLYFGKAVFPDLSRWRRNTVIDGIERQRSRLEDRDHSADLSDPIRGVWRYVPKGTDKEEGFLVGMRVGFGVLTHGTPGGSLNECHAVLQAPEASWKMPVTALDQDAEIDGDLSRIEASLWCGGVNNHLRRVTSIEMDGEVTILKLETDFSAK